uniref:BRCA1-associated ATM activator 1 n=1 Tax=Neogobius melanostomus TaxID=47308 RepID=A0A8C6TPZ2_9GOBI
MIKLTGLLAATVAGFQKLQDHSTLDQVFNTKHWQESSLWDDPSVKSGWVHGLRSMMQHPRALSFFVQSELMDQLLKLQTDPSLFVASSANQLLVHILLFYQPPATNGKHPTPEVEDRTHNGVEPPPFSSTDYNAVVMAICVYLRESLPPKEQMNLQDSARLLKLVAQILSEASPPLWGQLFEAACGSLEDLVAAGYSQLTLPLIEVILVAHSLSHLEQNVGRLLCAMLEVRQPTQHIRAAAAVLQKGFCDPVYTPKAARILLLPLDILTGQSLLCADTTGEAWGQIQEELQNKSLFTSMMCLCVANIHHIALLPPDFLPCPLGLIVSTVVSLLHMSLGDSSASPGCAKANRFIYGNGKIQKCALEALTALGNCSDVCDKMNEVCAVLLRYLNNPDSDPIVLHKCYQGLLKWTGSSTNRSLISVQLREDLAQLVSKRVCDLRWEVRDSTVEFLGQQATQTSFSVDPCQSSPLLLEERSTVPLLREALQDQESYVRASAVSALAQTLQRSWQQGAVVSHEQADIVTKLLEILCEDTEGFSRRAVVQFFTSWFSHTSSSSSSLPPLLMTSVPSVLSRGSSDLDWEVKVHALELAKLLMDSTLTGHTGAPHPYAAMSRPTFSALDSSLEDALKKLVDSGVVSALLSGLFDCDRPVGLKACQLLIRLRETLETSAEESAVKCGLPSFGWGLEIRALVENLSDAESVNVREVLRCLDLEGRLDFLSQSSDHVQNSPLSLLKDILTARGVHSHPNAGEGQEVIVDCY